MKIERTHVPQSTASSTIPLMESTTEELKDNTLIVVLGASGDLAKKKTYPALFGLFKLGFLPNDIHIVGYARTKMDDTQYHKHITAYIKNPNDDPEF